MTEDIVQIGNQGINRYSGQRYLESEMLALAKCRFEGYIPDQYRNPEARELQRDCISLERFGLLAHHSLYMNGGWRGWAWKITEEGTSLLEARKPMHYGCRCEHAIKLACVCAEKTFCPNPEHTGNGCFGTHD